MRVAVVTPYFREEDGVLRQCLDSVSAQTWPVTHILVADGFPKDWLSREVSHHITLPGKGHQDVGNLARAIGAALAVSEGFDAIALLDADNWFQPHHVSSLLKLHQETGAAICTSARSLHRLDGSLLVAHDPGSDGMNFADTSSLIYLRPAFGLLPVWGLMPRQFGTIGDRVMWAAIQSRKMKAVHSDMPTMAFRTSYSADYIAAGETPPANAKEPRETMESIAAWNSLSPAERNRILFGQ